MTKLKTIIQPETNKLIIERSEFITHLFPTDSIEEAKAHISDIRKEHYAATHNCTAYIIGDPIITQKSNDDGEPKGTAGMPMLQALSFQQVTNITAIVTRYYGGIKLGAGGLIRAYSNSVTEALNHALMATYETLCTLSFSITYDELNSLYVLESANKLFKIISIDYDAHLKVLIEALDPNISAITQQFIDTFSRHVTLEIIDKKIKKYPIEK